MSHMFSNEDTIDTHYYGQASKDKINNKIYIKVKYKFIISLIVSIIWVGFSIFLSFPWLQDLAELTNWFLAVFIIAGIAYIPGLINGFLITSLILDRQPQYRDEEPEDVTLLIAAYNEEASIYNTLEYIVEQDYKGNIRTIVINNNSNDRTREEVERAAKELNISIECIDEPNPGKFNALNTGLSRVSSKLVITLDADTLLHKSAIRYLVARMKSSPGNVKAVAGSVLVRNSRDNILARIQEWDYFLSISSIKKMQGLFQGTLVAQGAFSIYKLDILLEVGGWSDAIGEDIVLTWDILHRGYRVFYEPLAVAFTDVPLKFSHFTKQRSRWARGMIEGLRKVKPWQQPSRYSKFLTGINLVIPYIDFSYTFFWIPGLIFAFFGKFYIVGPMSLAVLPLTLATFLVLFYYQKKRVFDLLKLKVRKNIFGFVLFLLCYQIIMSPISMLGYVQEIFRTKRIWK